MEKFAHVLMLIFVLTAFFLVFFTFLIKILVIAKYFVQKRTRKTSGKVVGFFHPYCNAGGGGERVLWCAIRAIQFKYPDAFCVVYTGDIDANAKTIIEKANKTFGINFQQKVEFQFLQTRSWVEAKRYPLLTLLGQSIGSLILGIEALVRYPPDVYIDTMGYAFTMPIFKYLGGCNTGCYVHYPTISTDMLSVVKNQNKAFNNRPIIAKSKLLTSIKLLYYKFFAWIYGVCGRCSSVVMVNSSWTSGHIEHLWTSKNVLKIFPPCDIKGFLQFSIEERFKKANKLILSIGQFRPEKNHSLQIEVFHDFLSKIDESDRINYQLVMAGGCRNPGDEKRVAELNSLSKKLGVNNSVQIKTNISFNELKNLLKQADVGIHTMANEHFGIGVVEFQAAGVIALAHKSGGPLMDIIQTQGETASGYLADTVESYTECLREIFKLSKAEKIAVSTSARQACQRFSEREFEDAFLNAVDNLLCERNKKQ